MYSRHDEVPELSSRDGKVDALYYNHVQTALKRLSDNHTGVNEIRLTIPKLKHLDLVLQKDAWVIVDRALNDYPIAAWTNFQTEHRESLHEPIHCEIRLFHYAASMVLKRTLEAMDTLIEAALKQQLPEQKSDVLPFKKS